MKDVMTFEDMQPKLSISHKAIKREIKAKKEANINGMGTSTILWFLVVRHKFPLVVLYAVAATAVAVIKW